MLALSGGVRRVYTAHGDMHVEGRGECGGCRHMNVAHAGMDTRMQIKMVGLILGLRFSEVLLGDSTIQNIDFGLIKFF